MEDPDFLLSINYLRIMNESSDEDSVDKRMADRMDWAHRCNLSKPTKKRNKTRKRKQGAHSDVAEDKRQGTDVPGSQGRTNANPKRGDAPSPPSPSVPVTSRHLRSPSERQRKLGGDENDQRLPRSMGIVGGVVDEDAVVESGEDRFGIRIAGAGASSSSKKRNASKRDINLQQSQLLHNNPLDKFDRIVEDDAPHQEDLQNAPAEDEEYDDVVVGDEEDDVLAEDEVPKTKRVKVVVKEQLPGSAAARPLPASSSAHPGASHAGM